MNIERINLAILGITTEDVLLEKVLIWLIR